MFKEVNSLSKPPAHTQRPVILSILEAPNKLDLRTQKIVENARCFGAPETVVPVQGEYEERSWKQDRWPSTIGSKGSHLKNLKV